MREAVATLAQTVGCISDLVEVRRLVRVADCPLARAVDYRLVQGADYLLVREVDCQLVQGADCPLALAVDYRLVLAEACPLRQAAECTSARVKTRIEATSLRGTSS